MRESHRLAAVRSLSNVGTVFVGGSLGVLLRATLLDAFVGVGTTFAINIVGAFLLGALLETLGNASGWRYRLRLGLGTGLLGGFTTYSSFALETVLLWRVAPWLGLAYATLSLIVGVGAALFGVWLAQRLRPSRVAGVAS